jgi:hypothetical protein
MSKRRKEWPKTVEEAVDQLLSSMPEEYREVLKNTAEEDLALFNHGLGTYIRNEFGLWANNGELLKSCGSQMMPDSAYDDYLMMMVNPDEASMVIIKALWGRLQDQ